MESSPLTAETVAGESSQGKGVCAGLPLLTFGFYLVLLQSLPPGQGSQVGRTFTRHKNKKKPTTAALAAG